MKIVFLLSALVWLFTTAPFPPYLFKAISNKPVASKVDMPEMWIQNKDMFLGDTLQLRFKAPNARFLGVIDPDGHFFYLVYPVSESTQGLYPLVDTKTFIYLDHLDIYIASLKADPYRYGIMENQPVFTKNGIYTFLLGDNLHTDDPSALINTVEVSYNHIPRRTTQ